MKIKKKERKGRKGKKENGKLTANARPGFSIPSLPRQVMFTNSRTRAVYPSISLAFFSLDEFFFNRCTWRLFATESERDRQPQSFEAHFFYSRPPTLSSGSGSWAGESLSVGKFGPFARSREGHAVRRLDRFTVLAPKTSAVCRATYVYRIAIPG